MFARRLLINSMLNMREMGGYETLDGKITQFGRFIRSDAPVGLSDDDIRYLVSYGVTMAIDLRTEREADDNPVSLRNASGIRYCSIPFTDDFSILGDVKFCPLEHYVPLLQRRNRIGDILAAMADCKDGAVLFHCSAGKDRTGILAALLLLLARVPAEDVIADYEVTFGYIRKIIPGLLVHPDRPVELCRTDPEWLEPLLLHVSGEGGIEEYLSGTGLTRKQMQELKHRLTSP